MSALLSRFTSAGGQPKFSQEVLERATEWQRSSRQRAMERAPTRFEAGVVNARSTEPSARESRAAGVRPSERTAVGLFRHAAHHVLDSAAYPFVDLTELLVGVGVGGRRGGERSGGVLLRELGRVQLAAAGRVSVSNLRRSVPSLLALRTSCRDLRQRRRSRSRGGVRGGHSQRRARCPGHLRGTVRRQSVRLRVRTAPRRPDSGRAAVVGQHIDERISSRSARSGSGMVVASQ